MDINKNVIVFASLLIASLAVPAPAPATEDYSRWFQRTDRDARVIGGTPAAEGGIPYMAALTTGFWLRSFRCGGSILSPRTVLTAGHCIDSVYADGQLTSSFSIVVGTNHWITSGQSYAVASNLTHPLYHLATIKYDIGLLFIATNIVMSATVQTVTLNYNVIGGGVAARAQGWGRFLAETIQLSPSLMQLDKTTLDGEGCEREMGAVAAALGIQLPPLDFEIEICAFHAAEHGVCNGDSGSPLVLASNGQQIGIAAWVVRCAAGAPDMYVRISGFRQWIEENVI